MDIQYNVGEKARHYIGGGMLWTVTVRLPPTIFQNEKNPDEFLDLQTHKIGCAQLHRGVYTLKSFNQCVLARRVREARNGRCFAPALALLALALW